MALKRPPKAAQMTLNLAPMVDVMMCLIIFFLIASELIEPKQRVNLPWAVAAKEVDRSDLGAVVAITVRQAGAEGKDAEFVVADWIDGKVADRVLQPSDIQNLLMARAARAAADHQKLRCVIRADKMVMYQHVETVLRGCGRAKISDIVFSANTGVEPKEGA